MISRFFWFFGAAVVPSVLAVVAIPLTTFKLDPRDFGVFAVIGSFTAFGAGVSGLGSSYLLLSQFPVSDEAKRSRLVSTILAMGFAVWIVVSVLFLILWLGWLCKRETFSMVPTSFILLALATAVCGFPWTVTTDMLTLAGASRDFAVTSIAQAVVGVVVVVAALYVFHLGAVALYLGALASALTTAVIALRQLRPYLGMTLDRGIVRELLKYTSTVTGANALDGAQVIVERNWLASSAGLSVVGLYSHSQSYRRMMFLAMKSVSRALLPDTLAEARAKELEFPRTRNLWALVYTVVFVIGIVFAVWGAGMIGWLTHGKFSEASTLVAMWMVMLLVQFSGRSQNGYLIARDHGLPAARIAMVANLVGVAAAIALIPKWHAWGAFVAVFLSMSISRALVHVYTRRQARIPFDDLPVLVGSVVIALTVWLSPVMAGNGARQIGLAAAACACYGALCNRAMGRGVLAVRRLLQERSAA